jgi:hypothetical protein
MLPFEPKPAPKAIRRSIDWRCWLMLAWVAWFGYLYGAMIWQTRGSKLVGKLRSIASASPSSRTAERRW